MLIDGIELINGVLTGADLEKILSQPDSLIVVNGQARWYPSKNIQILSIKASVGTPAIGNSVLSIVRKNGTSIIGSSIEITSGMYESASVIPITQTAVVGDYFTVDVTQVGTVNPGKDLSVLMVYERI